MGRFTKVQMSGPEPNTVVLAELKGLRERVPWLTGTLVASSDGLLVAHDLPAHIEPTGMAALAAAQLSLSHLITLSGQYHLIRPMTGRKSRGLFLYLALDRGRANLALARHRLRGIEEELEF
ncbi:hypothetical protein [Nocardia brevicatena]|uniref:hypothetical protein n=1 Tax=Nocardia brevicatena TaxID=37327 RepID=UPI0006871CB2|nr:hypothetical protein [Nocardia brevicatena]